MDVCVLGSINIDIVQRVERLPRPGETVLSRSTARLLGGKGANQAIAAARMGAGVRLLATVGSDSEGHDLLARLAAEGVDISQVRRSAQRATGAAFISVSDAGENMIVVAPGANAEVHPSDWSAGALEGQGVYLAQLETPIPTIRAFLETADANGGLSILNAAPALVEASPLFELADILVVNETELATFSDIAEPPDGPVAAETAARRLLCRIDQTVIVTLGAAGALAVSRAGAHWTRGRKAEVVDTTGAGDCFCGALAARLSLGDDLAVAMEAANAAASLAVSRPGASASMPEWSDVEPLLR